MNQGNERCPHRPEEGRYANYFKVGHNAFEFVLDYGQFFPENGKVAFHTRIVTGPAYAKALLKTLQEAIDEFETAYGAIREEEDKPDGDINET